MSKDATKKAALTALDVVRVFLAFLWSMFGFGMFYAGMATWERLLNILERLVG